ncbi:MAG TPA: twin-arginine translocase subunit TatC [Phycisphaerae bacterium]|nr:twin-arginine translocase subunit TatC [Phycisphaerae bacterium]
MFATFRRQPVQPDEKRMTLGEHLDELRGCLLRSLVALVLLSIPCIFFARYLLEVLVRPLVLALRANNQPETLLATSPAETLLVYVKVVLISALILGGPYIIYQLWTFVAAGLYPNERAWVHRLTLPSVLLFLLGVAFMYLFALLVSLNFLVGFGNWLPLPRANPNALEQRLLSVSPAAPATTQPALENWPTVPVVAQDPAEPPVGAIWFNVNEHRFKVRQPDKVYSYQFQPDQQRAMVSSHFKIGEYLSFVLLLTIAFGVAFQLPLVVVFLARTGLVPVETMRRYRKVAILLIVFIACMLAPPDLLSHLLLSGPMLILFEIGVLIAARQTTPAAPAD